ncbi:MAG TPA: hypothetical protein VHC44_01325 [Verrucomicrobiae bacterium]|nr:hypothetical protein [Verrucomicrobiae bacterium]
MVKLFWVVLWVLPIAGLITTIAISKHRPGLLKQGKLRPPPPKVQRLMDKWHSQEFVKLDSLDDGGMQSVVERISFSYPPSVHPQEAAQLTNTVVNFLRAYSEGSFDSLTQFRFPIKDFYYSTVFGDYLKKGLSIPEQTVKEHPEEAWQVYWQARIKNRLTNYWVGLSVSNSSVAVEEVPKLTNTLLQVVQKLENVGTINPVPFAFFVSSPDKVSSEYGSLKVATIRVLPETKLGEAGDPVYPVYARLYWSPKDGKWLFESMVSTWARPEGKRMMLL